MTDTGTVRIVILGGGFGGAYLAQSLQKYAGSHNLEIIIIDRNNFFVFYPLLVEAGTGSIEPRHCTVPIRDFARKSDLLMAEVKGLDLEEKSVRYRLIGDDQDRSIDYDHLVIALGSVTRILPENIVSGVREHAFEMKHMTDAVAVRDRSIELLELANATTDPVERKRLLHFIIVGGNVTGIEVVGELESFVRDATIMYRNLRREDCTFTVVELAPTILGILPEHLHQWAHRQLTKRGIQIYNGISVNEVHVDHVVTSEEKKIPCSTVIWTAGIAPNPILRQFDGLPLNKFGGLDCEGDYAAKGLENVWGLGDCACVPCPDGKPMPPLAQIAIRQAPQLAGNIVATIRGEATKPADVHVQGILVPLGRHRGVASLKGMRMEGFIAWAMWRAIYLLKTPGWRRRFRVAMDWFINLFCKRDYVQLGMIPASHREFHGQHHTGRSNEELGDSQQEA
ncbi:MAG: NAD(P)/FAD-dependent oxidoreductase [Phycisphaerales bacterium]|nr:NAD(P)/FAD-dependent oxidoreductase [Phycisphaerales bacterium]